MATYVLTIAGTTKTVQQGWSIRDPANGVGTMTFAVYSADGSYVPALDAAVIFTEDSTRIFAGPILNVRERGAGEIGRTPIVSEITVSDNNVLAQRRSFTGATVPAGTLKSQLQYLCTNYLFTTTVWASQVNGPAMPDATYNGWSVQEILDQWATNTGYVWEITYDNELRMFTPGSLTAGFNLAAGDGNAIGDVIAEPTRYKYANRVVVMGTGVFSVVEDATEITAHGIWDLIVQAPDTTVQADADALAAAILADRLPLLKTVTYDTYRTGLTAGMTQTINLPTRHLNNTFLITEVVTRGSARRDKSPLRTVTAVEGLTFQGGWREDLQQWGGTGGLMLTGGGGGGGGGTSTHRMYWLGGNGLDATRSPTPTWVPASGGGAIGQGAIQAQIDTTVLGTTAATVKVRLRALDAGVSVQARLYDVTNSVACAGTSAVITSTSWSFASFAVTLVAGNHLYELQLLPGTANADVQGTGYVEGG